MKWQHWSILVGLLVSCCASAQNLGVYNGQCGKGGQQVITQGLGSSGTEPIGTTNASVGAGVVASYPYCTVTVYLTGTVTPASIFQNNLVSPQPLSNPFQANTDGSFLFYAASQTAYDIVMSSSTSNGPPMPTPLVLTSVVPCNTNCGALLTVQTNATNNANQFTLNFQNGNNCNWTNPSLGNEQVTCVGGANRQVQFNNGGVLGGDPTFTFTPGTGPWQFGTGAPNGAAAPVLLTSQMGSNSNYVINSTSITPINYMSFWQGTPATTNGFQGYDLRLDMITEPGIDVQSSATLGTFASCNGNNSVGFVNDNKTNCTAFVANSSGGGAGASANNIGMDALGIGVFTGSGTHLVQAGQFGVAAARPPGWFKDTSHDYTTGVSSLIQSGSTQGGSAAYLATSSAANQEWLVGMQLSSIVNYGVGVLQGQNMLHFIPHADFWAAQADTYGMFCGTGISGALYTSNPDDVPLFNQNPPACVAAGPSAALSGDSSLYRMISTSAGGAEQDFDFQFTHDQIAHFKFAGNDEATMDNLGDFSIMGGLTIEQTGANKISIVSTPTAARTVTVQDASITMSGGVFQDCGATSGATQNCAGTVKPVFYVVRGQVTLNGSAFQSIGNLPFTAGGDFSCSGGDVTNSAGVVSFNTYAASSVTVQESGGGTSDVIKWTCSGW